MKSAAASEREGQKKARGSLWVAAVLLGVACNVSGHAQSLGEALNATNLAWSTGGNAGPWTVTTNITHDGIAAAQAGNFAFESSWLQTTVTGQTAVSFWWKLDSMPGADFLEFDIDGARAAQITGTVDWERHILLVPPGARTLKWLYTFGGYSSVYSNVGWVDEISLQVPAPPEFTMQPTNQLVSAGNSALLSAAAIGVEPISFQWFQNGSNLAGATTASLSLSNLQAPNAGQYSLVASNQFGSATSQVASLSVEPSIPVVREQPVSQSSILGGDVQLGAAAVGTEPIFWQWYLDGQVLAGETSNIISITNLQTLNAGAYRVTASNEVGVATSQVATVSVILAPVITQSPKSQAVPPGAPATFSADAVSSGQQTWQWYLNGEEVAGANSSQFTLPAVGSSDYGPYRAVVSNSYGSATSGVAVLTYTPVLAWGNPQVSQTNVPVDATNVVALAAGDYHLLALRRDGSFAAGGCDCWFKQYPGPIDVPSGETNILDIAAGSADSLALRKDGSVLLLGFLLGNGRSDVPPEASSNVVSVARGCGAQHALILRKDGTVFDWGSMVSAGANVPPTATNVVAVAAGAYHSVALRADGTVVMWGNQGPISVNASVSNVVAVASQWDSDIGLRADRSVMFLPSGSVWLRSTNVAAIACGGNHNIALLSSGIVLAAGDNTYGQINTPAWATNIVAIAGARSSTLALLGEGPPIVTSPLVDRSILEGRTVYFYATAAGQLPLNYQWQCNGTNVPGATNAILAISNTQVAQSGSYSVSVSNALGTAQSEPAELIVLPKQASIQVSSITTTNGQFGFNAVGPAGPVWALQGSIDLTNWTNLRTLTNSTGIMWVTDPATNLVQHFYRLRFVR